MHIIDLYFIHLFITHSNVSIYLATDEDIAADEDLAADDDLTAVDDADLVDVEEEVREVQEVDRYPRRNRKPPAYFHNEYEKYYC